MRTTLGGSAVAGPVVTAVATAVLLTGAPAYAAPMNRYEMPFPCGQEWTGTTRPSHSPDSRAIDWNRPGDVGDDVVASAPGTVSSVTRSATSYGNHVRVAHAHGESTLYAHLYTLSVAAGQRVDQGARLGTVGSTGNSTGPHLHFEERNASGVMAPYFGGVRFVFGSTQASENCVDVPLAGDFLGTGEAEVATFRRATTSRFRIQRPGKKPLVVRFGTSTAQPVVGDWDGNGKSNIGVRDPVTKTFSLRTAPTVSTIVFGTRTDLPIAGDWDGDGAWEVGVRRARLGKFRLRSADGTVSVAFFGDANDIPVTGDWNGDSVTDLGVYDQATAAFTLRLVDDQGLAWSARVPFGEPGDLPVTADWDGNGRTDLGVWDPDTGVFSKRLAANPAGVRVRAVTQVRFGKPR